MDPFSAYSPGFIDLLASQSSPGLDLDYAEPVGNSPGNAKPSLKRKWAIKEDLLLISGWLNTSKDSIVSNKQKGGSLWRRIEDYFNSNAQLSGCLPREWSACKQRWGRINEQVCKFVGSYEAALKEQSSGQNDNDVMKAAHDIFFNDNHAKFTMEHCWRELRYDQKWKSLRGSRDGEKDKRKADEVPPTMEDVRPPGVKACKAAKRKRHENEDAFDQIESIFAAKQKISQQKLLDRLLAKNENDLSPNEITLKNKLISAMVD